MASCRGMPFRRYWLMYSGITMPLFTTMPISSSNPMAAGESKFAPDNAKGRDTS